MTNPRNDSKGGPDDVLAAPERLSQVAENYLLSLYILGEEGLRATSGQLAEYIRTLPAGEGLGTTLPSITGMLRRMAREGLVEMTAAKEVKLTPRGVVLAEGMVRRHRLAERMVVDLLGLELHKAHEEAHRLEHAISPDLEVKIRERLGNPTTCPFGRPIPGSGYTPPPALFWPWTRLSRKSVIASIACLRRTRSCSVSSWSCPYCLTRKSRWWTPADTGA